MPAADKPAADAKPGFTLKGSFTQGALVVGETDPKAQVKIDGRQLKVSPSGRFVFGFGYKYKARSRLDVRLPSGRKLSQVIELKKRSFKTQRIDGLPQKMVTIPEKTLVRIRAENKLIGRARLIDHATPWFESGFIWPAQGPISGVYGSRRILNGQPRRPHFGVDVALPVGSPVVAPADGRVTMAEPDLYFTGGTLIIHHGYGVSTTYSHLHSLEVKVGQIVKQGDLIATIGATGRVTGPHLDWRLNWFRERLDPVLVVPPMPKPKK